MKQNYLKLMLKNLFLLFILIGFIAPVSAQKEALIGKDLTISLGAGKNRFFENEIFELAAPIELPLKVNLGINKRMEAGAEYQPIIFNNRSAIDLAARDSNKNQFSGSMHSANVNFQYSLQNNYRFNGYIQLSGGYTFLHTKHYKFGELNEVIGNGYNWSATGGLRYQLGNTNDDVFNWFFDFGLAYTRFNIDVTDSRIDGISLASDDKTWKDLNFGSVDVIIQIGYRFRFKR